MKLTDRDYMTLALQMARATAGQTSPNPMVGAVVVNEGAIVGIGAHLKAGEPHAEVHALRMAGERAKGATIYVTLEPCSHYGRTPPCAIAIREAGIARVVIAAQDPNPLVAGRGISMLREAGIEVDTGVLAAEAEKLNEIFFHFVQTRKPFVTIKTASTLDGKIATVAGHSKWITGKEARQQVHKLRQQSDAILVGVNTVLADDPALTARIDDQETKRQPVRIILDSSLRIPPNARVLTDRLAETWIYTTERSSPEKRAALEQMGAKVLVMEGTASVPIGGLLTSLGERGITSLLVEGGSAVNGSFLQARAINKIVSYFSCKLVGGADAPTPFGGSGLAVMNQAVELKGIRMEQISPTDFCIEGYPDWVCDRTAQERV
ncbi:bifunctional diaminohydroxyphosphoribosylaminopyrimidine deaminase/5-amino-6-(5-phosphoribosylamino)uracil reductase RibD [Brevibacillus fulvus]|nr:bifunctional diaminohydroxyphosphoribosylaminopyrimidine deaminase/5-amino-6-(5-phosphoribosylamino)uracil reductase RibD [Brevibacillus fulvus]